MPNSNMLDGRPYSKGRPSVYSNRLQKFDSVESTLLGEQVFTGDQPDDFAMAGFAGNEPEVLILGAGLGSAIRGILAVNPLSKVTVVDNSKGQLSILNAIFEEYFPELTFHSIEGDAEDIELFLPGQRFDVICVDLYSENNYAPFIARNSWWQKLTSNHLRPSGFVLANSWGLPTHLNPLSRDGVQAHMVRAMQSAFDNLTTHSFRRNITLSSRKLTKTASPRSKNYSNLTIEDRLWLRLLYQRFTTTTAALSSNIQPDGSALPMSHHQGAHINNEMGSLWKESTNASKDLAEILSKGDLQEIPGASIAHIINSIPCPERDFFPNSWSISEHQYSEVPDIFLILTKNISKHIYENDYNWYVNVWLTQFASVILKSSPSFKSSDNYDHWIEILSEKIDELEKMKHA